MKDMKELKNKLHVLHELHGNLSLFVVPARAWMLVERNLEAVKIVPSLRCNPPRPVSAR